MFAYAFAVALIRPRPQAFVFGTVLKNILAKQIKWKTAAAAASTRTK